MPISNNKVYPWRANNSFKLLQNGSAFYPKMLKAINKAEKLILLETYFVESGIITTQFITALIKATQRGVKIFVLFDDMGSRGLNDSDKSILIKNGVNLCLYHPIKFSNLLNNFHRDHRKLLLVDNQIAFVGGAGLSDQFIGDDYWRDNMVEIRGSVILDWHTLYLQNWQRRSKTEIPLIKNNHTFPNFYKALGKVSYTRGYFFNQIKKNLHNQISSSKSHVWLASAYFVPSLKLRRILSQAAKRGVEIKIMVPGVKTDNNMSRYIGQGYYSRLLQNNIRIFEYQNHFIHSKLVVVDDWVTIGSSNLDRWAAKWNLEANQEIIDENFTLSVMNMFNRDVKNCHEITIEHWKNIATTQKIKVWFWRYMGRLIAKIGLDGRK
jgi:phosphatidylserine/phosphatidylglycerophosphate/cardiolipin synthase-like enzyme